MFRLDADLRIYLHHEPIDFRAGINSLVTLVEQSMQLDPSARAVYAFRNRKRNLVKLLLYERSGFWLMLKRLEADHFVTQAYGRHLLIKRVNDEEPIVLARLTELGHNRYGAVFRSRSGRWEPLPGAGTLDEMTGVVVTPLQPYLQIDNY
ncbi:IS66 family insertion sequence element accessory protein TnpB [Burkholderia pyrrocinia]|uniref:IS66 family insertion sequence element accessory protein TnpB n=1 Tax=Burkholderia pyrrocinia TaxID=60550 RepID=UPI0015895365|nr:IS66 family insertion sequence element accessory protein TnpB [Burkholderia pyrrocinia]